jgi:hypothetical protein
MGTPVAQPAFMQSRSWRGAMAIGALSAFTMWGLSAAANPNRDKDIDNHVPQSNNLVGASSVSGETKPSLKYPSHTYTAQKDGLVRIVMETVNVSKNIDSETKKEIALRPYLRVHGRNAEAWSTNGYRHPDSLTASAELVFRAERGQRFTVVATLGAHLVNERGAHATYTLTAKE